MANQLGNIISNFQLQSLRSRISFALLEKNMGLNPKGTTLAGHPTAVALAGTDLSPLPGPDLGPGTIVTVPIVSPGTNKHAIAMVDGASVPFR